MALQFVPDGALVLGLRPDITDLTPVFVNFLTGLQKGDIKVTQATGGVYKSAVFVNSGFLACPFYINDIILLASKPDLKRIFHFDYGFEFFGFNLATEQFFILRAFADKIPLFDTFARLNTGLVFEKPELTQRLMRAQLDSDFFMEAWRSTGYCWETASTLDLSHMRAEIRIASKERSVDAACLICSPSQTRFLGWCATLVRTRPCARETIPSTFF